MLFVGSLSLYVFSLGGALPPYRDAGEMAVLLSTLGVAHPPGYPLYTLIGKLASLFPLGTPGYAAGLVSGIFGALGVALLFWVLEKKTGTLPALLTAAWLGVSNPYWELAVVPEMYSLGFFWIVLLIWATVDREDPLLFCFLFPLGLGVRLDMALLFPVFVLAFLWKKKIPHPFHALVLFGLGMSVFGYLYVRSKTNPLLDWGNPETLSALYRSLSRASYGSTLDLLSLNYGKGENFGSSLSFLFQNFFSSWGVVGVGLTVLGVWSKRLFQDRDALFFMGCFLFLGPIYLFLANMPPNPHSEAVLDANFPAAFIFISFFLARGLGRAFQFIRFRWGLAAILLIVVSAQGYSQYDRGARRNNFYTRDYVHNVFKSTPLGGIVILKEDVQLFSVWEQTLLHGKRSDAAFISQGLSGSEWYWDMLERQDLDPGFSFSAKTEDGLRQALNKKGKKALLIGKESEIPGRAGFSLIPRGLLSEFKEEGGGDPHLMSCLFVYRGDYVYGQPPDFFSSDLISDYARAAFDQGVAAAKDDQTELAIQSFRRASAFEPHFPPPYIHLGFLWFKAGEWAKAEATYRKALRANEKLAGMAEAYNSLPEVKKGIQKDMADIHLHLGTALDRQNQKEAAVAHFEESVRLFPSSQGYYNLAVAHWGTNWEKTRRSLQESLRLNPNNAEAARYLSVLMGKK